MKKHIILGVIFTMAAINSISAQSIKKRVEDKSTAIDEYIGAEMEKRKIPGLALGICDKHHLIAIRSYGYADVQNKSVVTDNTVFELASLTKQFTAAAILLLAQQNKINLSDPIKLYLDTCPVRWQGITIRHLLTHTSGLPAMGTGYSGFLNLSNEQYLGLLWLKLSKETSFAIMKTDSLDFSPGSKFSYSDIGYELLGHIINKVTGSYREFIQKNIFDRVGMKDSYILDQTVVHPYEARGYTLRNGELVNIRRVWDIEIPSHSGIFSNIRDLSKWDSVLNTEALLSNQSKSMMWTPTPLNNGDYSDYGFGWFTKTMNKRLIVNHTGVTGTEYIKYVSDSVSVIVLTNLGIGFYDAVNSWGMAPHIGKMILGYNLSIDSTYVTKSGLTIKKVKPEIAKKMVATYELSKSKLVRKIYLENDRLIYNNGTASFELAQLSDGSFIKLGVETEQILEAVSKDFTKLKWKGNEEMLLKVSK
ncbi:MAG: beta-lactamase family protein [Bacteroidia bacterium]|nr:beta-lactamase family protein [Bacteroidia bacterium]